MSQQDYLPHHASEKLFRFYEPFITRLVAEYPRVQIIDPRSVGRATETFTARMRSAMKSYKENHWSSTIDRKKFLEIYPDIIVSARRGLIYLGTKSDIESANGNIETTPTINAAPPSVEPIEFPLTPIASNIQFETLCRLANDRLLSAPLILTIPLVWAEEAQSKFDIALTPHGSQFILS